ncbi:hypothetical protein SAY87_012814 [Trapa incisa]|uniref:Uncharacterized protein n=1 Tax=Trapa incisa TaxID=236973 RepID=A0AAN7H1J5_9MYRT|nr:hypothetical protein SAY87_012814 [Trapa incisa]
MTDGIHEGGESESGKMRQEVSEVRPCRVDSMGDSYAPPIMALFFILDEEVVKLWPHARAIRDVEDEELWSFFYVLTAVLTGSLYYVAASPKDLTYLVAPVLRSPTGHKDVKKIFAAWYERRQMKKIYSPLLEGLLALYHGFEWIQTNNILTPIITHGIYSYVILGHRLWKIHDQQLYYWLSFSSLQVEQ